MHVEVLRYPNYTAVSQYLRSSLQSSTCTCTCIEIAASLCRRCKKDTHYDIASYKCNVRYINYLSCFRWWLSKSHGIQLGPLSTLYCLEPDWIQYSSVHWTSTAVNESLKHFRKLLCGVNSSLWHPLPTLKLPQRELFVCWHSLSSVVLML